MRGDGRGRGGAAALRRIATRGTRRAPTCCAGSAPSRRPRPPPWRPKRVYQPWCRGAPCRAHRRRAAVRRDRGRTATACASAPRFPSGCRMSSPSLSPIARRPRRPLRSHPRSVPARELAPAVLRHRGRQRDSAAAHRHRPLVTASSARGSFRSFAGRVLRSIRRAAGQLRQELSRSDRHARRLTALLAVGGSRLSGGDGVPRSSSNAFPRPASSLSPRLPALCAILPRDAPELTTREVLWPAPAVCLQRRLDQIVPPPLAAAAALKPLRSGGGAAVLDQLAGGQAPVLRGCPTCRAPTTREAVLVWLTSSGRLPDHYPLAHCARDSWRGTQPPPRRRRGPARPGRGGRTCSTPAMPPHRNRRPGRRCRGCPNGIPTPTSVPRALAERCSSGTACSPAAGHAEQVPCASPPSTGLRAFEETTGPAGYFAETSWRTVRPPGSVDRLRTFASPTEGPGLRGVLAATDLRTATGRPSVAERKSAVGYTRRRRLGTGLKVSPGHRRDAKRALVVSSTVSLSATRARRQECCVAEDEHVLSSRDGAVRSGVGRGARPLVVIRRTGLGARVDAPLSRPCRQPVSRPPSRAAAARLRRALRRPVIGGCACRRRPTSQAKKLSRPTAPFTRRSQQLGPPRLPPTRRGRPLGDVS